MHYTEEGYDEVPVMCFEVGGRIIGRHLCDGDEALDQLRPVRLF